MAQDVELLSKLLAALGQRRLDEALRLGEEMADQEARRGHARVARRLRGALAQNDSAEVTFEPLTTRTSVAGALLQLQTVESLDRVVLPDAIRGALGELLQEWRLREKLRAAGVSRRTKVLFFGAPGCGKTLTARALGGEMNLPSYVVKFDSVVGAYLGQTAARLRELFRYAEAVPCVLVIDEIDAVAQRRGNTRDVGELDRVVISLMQELEHSNPQGLIVACSNLANSLDEALWRRFDLAIEIPKPSAAQILSFLRDRLSTVGVQPETSLSSIAKGMGSYADADRAVANIQRRHILKKEME